MIDLVDEGVAFTRRPGGVSCGPYSGLNLSLTVGDDPEAVERNRALVAEALGIDPRWVTVTQVHGSDIHVASEGARSQKRSADAIVATGGSPIAVMVADCVPIAIEGEDSYAVVHGGWRSLASGIVEKTVGLMEARRAWIGPSIGPCHYEVGEEVVRALGDRPVVASPSETGKVNLDLAGTVCEVLTTLGVEVVYRSSSCTACAEDLFSYRRSGVTGRQAVLMWR